MRRDGVFEAACFALRSGFAVARASDLFEDGFALRSFLGSFLALLAVFTSARPLAFLADFWVADLARVTLFADWRSFVFAMRRALPDRSFA